VGWKSKVVTCHTGTNRLIWIFWKTGQQTGTENVNWCTVEVQFEIDKITETRIEGRAMRAKSFDVKKCKPGELEWQPFTWIPK